MSLESRLSNSNKTYETRESIIPLISKIDIVIFLSLYIVSRLCLYILYNFSSISFSLFSRMVSYNKIILVCPDLNDLIFIRSVLIISS